MSVDSPIERIMIGATAIETVHTLFGIGHPRSVVYEFGYQAIHRTHAPGTLGVPALSSDL